MAIPPRRLDFDRRVAKTAVVARELKALRSLKRSAVPPPPPLPQSEPAKTKAIPRR